MAELEDFITYRRQISSVTAKMAALLIEYRKLLVITPGKIEVGDGGLDGQRWADEVVVPSIKATKALGLQLTDHDKKVDAAIRLLEQR